MDVLKEEDHFTIGPRCEAHIIYHQDVIDVTYIGVTLHEMIEVTP